jgi:hypothetical protein
VSALGIVEGSRPPPNQGKEEAQSASRRDEQVRATAPTVVRAKKKTGAPTPDFFVVRQLSVSISCNVRFRTDRRQTA